MERQFYLDNYPGIVVENGNIIGPEKSRIVLIVIFGLVMTVALLGQKILDSLTLDLHIDLGSLVAKLNTTPKGIVTGAGLAASVLFLILSMWISIKVMENKEY